MFLSTLLSAAAGVLLASSAVGCVLGRRRRQRWRQTGRWSVQDTTISNQVSLNLK